MKTAFFTWRSSLATLFTGLFTQASIDVFLVASSKKFTSNWATYNCFTNNGKKRTFIFRPHFVRFSSIPSKEPGCVDCYFSGKTCCNLSVGAALNVRFTTNMALTWKWRKQAIIEWSRRMYSIVACCHVKLAHLPLGLSACKKLNVVFQ